MESRIPHERSTPRGAPRAVTDTVRARRDWALNAEARTVGDHATPWKRTLAEIADRAGAPHYDGLRLAPIPAAKGVVALHARAPVRPCWSLARGRIFCYVFTAISTRPLSP